VQLKYTRYFLIHKPLFFEAPIGGCSGTRRIELSAITTPQIGTQRGFALARSRKPACHAD
jgi:hypothetical protein